MQERVIGRKTRSYASGRLFDEGCEIQTEIGFDHDHESEKTGVTGITIAKTDYRMSNWT